MTSVANVLIGLPLSVPMITDAGSASPCIAPRNKPQKRKETALVTPPKKSEHQDKENRLYVT
jgi:hypothetical protein